MSYVTYKGEVWEGAGEWVTSPINKREFFLSDDLLMTLIQAHSASSPVEYQNKDQIIKTGDILHAMDVSPKNECGPGYLLPIAELDGKWSHPVDDKNPNFDAIFAFEAEPTLYVNTEDNRFAIQSHVSPKALGDESPKIEDVFNLMEYSEAEQAFQIRAHCRTFAEAERALERIDHSVRPLPTLGYDKSAFMPLPVDPTAPWLNGSYAELQLVSGAPENDPDGYTQMCRVHVMNRDGECLASAVESLHTVMDLRDGYFSVEQFTRLYEHKDQDDILKRFRSTEPMVFTSVEDVRDQLSWLEAGDPMVMRVADGKHELQISWHIEETYRETNGKMIHHGRAIPPLRKLDDYKKSDVLVHGREVAYRVLVKHVDGAAICTSPSFVVSAANLYDVCNDPHQLARRMLYAERKVGSFDHNARTGDPISEAQRVALAVGGSFSDIEYTSSNRVEVSRIKAMIEGKCSKYEMQPQM